MKKHFRPGFLTVISGIILPVLILLVLYIAKEYVDIASLQKQYGTDLTEKDYPYHCAFLTSTSLPEFWESVYQSAREAGSEDGIYVENFGEDLSVSYTSNELLKMAIAAKVDAIIMEGTDDYTSTQLVNEAVEEGIVVSTIYRDNMSSARYSYIGINNVSTGYDYGTLALKYCKQEDPSVIVLLDSQDETAESRLMLSGIDKAIGETWSNAKIESLTVDGSSTFEVEEDLRQFLKDQHDTVDVVICTNLTQTQFLSQLAVDLNYVGDFTIIGSYQNTAVLEYLANGVISASIAIDSAQMGEKAIANLSEYLQSGHTSDYSQVDVHTLEKEDAIEALSGGEDSQAESENEGGDAA